MGKRSKKQKSEERKNEGRMEEKETLEEKKNVKKKDKKERIQCLQRKLDEESK